MQKGKFFIRSLLIAAATIMLTACGSTVPSGHVGVKVSKYGDDRGVSMTVLTPGRYYLGWNTDLFLFPTFTQTDKWTKSHNEGKAADESITFQAQGGIGVNVDIGVAYHVESGNAAKVFQKYHRGIEEISDNFMRNMVRDALNEHGTNYDVEALQGAGKQKLIDEVIKDVQKQAAVVGITVESLSYLSDLRFPPNVVAAINSKIQATQDAMRVENEVRKTKAEAEKQIVTAQAQVQVAKAEAESTRVRGEALRQNQDVLKLKEVENQAEAIKKWNGQLPTYSGSGAVPFISVK